MREEWVVEQGELAKRIEGYLKHGLQKHSKK